MFTPDCCNILNLVALAAENKFSDEVTGTGTLMGERGSRKKSAARQKS